MSLPFKLGDRVREPDGRHEGTVVYTWNAVSTSKTKQFMVRVKWDETGWRTDILSECLELISHPPEIRKIGSSYFAWTSEWEGPLRPDHSAALADLRDWLQKRS